MKNSIENITVDGWKVEVTYIPSHGKYVAEAFDSDGNKFDSVASTNRQQTINTAVALANAREYYRPFGEGDTKTTQPINEYFNDYGGKKEKPQKKIQYHEKRPHSLGAFLLAFVIVIVLFVLSCPAIMAVVGWLFRL